MNIMFTLLTKLSTTYDAISKCIKTTLQGIYDAHSEVTWIFTSPNTYPLIVNSSWNITNALRIYYPSTFRFYKISNSKAYADIITVNIRLGDIEYDISTFLYATSWSSEMDVPPSLYELLLLYLMKEKTYIPYETLNCSFLNVLTCEGIPMKILLDSEFAKKPFYGWETDDLKID